MRSAFQRLSESFQFYFRRGLDNLRDGRFLEAIEDLGRAANHRVDFADVHNFLGVAHGELEEWEEAIAAFRRAVASSPGYLTARLNLGFALAGTAVRVHRIVVELEPLA